MAGSSCQGMLVAPSTRIPVSSWPTPCIYRVVEAELRCMGNRSVSHGSERSRHECRKRVKLTWMRNSVLILRLASLSPSPRAPARESISSIKMMAGLLSLAIWNNCLTSLCARHQRISSAGSMTGRRRGSRRTDRSDSPIHLLTRSLELTLKNVLFASVATAFAKKLFPVPGGP